MTNINICGIIKIYNTCVAKSIKGASDIMKNTKNSSNNKQIRYTKIYMIVGYSIVIFIAIIFISVLTFSRTSKIMEQKTLDMTSALNVQLKLNINSYLTKLETTGALIFATPEIYEYDAINPDCDEYEALQTEKIVDTKLMELCIMENYVDFGIVYANNHSVGKLSNGTKNLFDDKLYSELEKIITRNRTMDGWATGCLEDYKRMYYVKRVNENAVFVSSFYITELENVFVIPDALNDMKVRLVNGRDFTVYSTESDEIGMALSETISERITNLVNVAFVDQQFLITVNNCGNNLRVICSIPRAIILKELNDIYISMLLIASVAVVISIILGIWLAVRIINPVNNLVSTLDSQARIDRLTGILNKRSFEEAVGNCLSNEKKMGALLILDVDNFKGVNDTLGHSYGDKVLANIGQILRDNFRASDFLGRIGGDEFAVFLNISEKETDNFMNIVISQCKALCEAFHNNYTGDDNTYKISASIGVSISPENGKNFAELYKCADKALYFSKKNGKDTYTIYNEAMMKAGDSVES